MNERVLKMPFADIYPMYLQKIERKGRAQVELDAILEWLTGFDKSGLQSQIDSNATLEEFFANAQIHENANKIKGVICGYRVEDIEDPLEQKIRWMDKIVDELAKGKAMSKIIRE